MPSGFNNIMKLANGDEVHSKVISRPVWRHGDP